MSRGPEYIETPGFVDLHAHFREPGSNKAETIASGTRAALLGGYVLVADMPNNPGRPTWSEEAMLEKHEIGQSDAFIPITFNAGWQPETPSSDDPKELAKMAHMSLMLKLYGGVTVGTPRDYEAREFVPAISTWHAEAPTKPIAFHAGKDNLEDMVELVARQYSHPLHVCHVNSSDQVDIVRKAKFDDLPVTCGVCPHHLLKTSHDVHSEGWFARMQPPLADQDEAEYLMRKLANGDIDIIETDHAPHLLSSKWQAEAENPEGSHEPSHTTCFGVPSIEVAAPLLFYQALVRKRISMERLVNAMSTKPAEILGVRVRHSTKATWHMAEYRIHEETSSVQSDSGWTPYLGKLALGVVDHLQIGTHVLIRGEKITGRHPEVLVNRGKAI